MWLRVSSPQLMLLCERWHSHLRQGESSSVEMSSMYTKKGHSPRIDPCGTPDGTLFQSAIISTRCLWLVKNPLIHLRRGPWIPILSSLSSNLSWGTVSNALEKSIKTAVYFDGICPLMYRLEQLGLAGVFLPETVLIRVQFATGFKNHWHLSSFRNLHNKACETNGAIVARRVFVIFLGVMSQCTARFATTIGLGQPTSMYASNVCTGS